MSDDVDRTAAMNPVVGSAGTPPAVAGATARLAGSILAGMVSGLALQIWIVAFLGWQGAQALYIRSVYAPVGLIILAVTQGLVVAAQVCAGTAARHGQRTQALRHAATFLFVGSAFIGLVAVVVVLMGDAVLPALGVPSQTQPLLVVFIVTVSAASVLGLVPALAVSAIRGIGKALAAAAFGAGLTILAIAAMALLHASTDLGVLAVPLGEFVAVVVVGSLSIAVLSRYGIGMPRWRVSMEGLRQLWVLAAPVAATFLLLSVASFAYLRVLRHAGDIEITGFSLGQIATQFIMAPALAIGSAAAIAANLHPHNDRSVPSRAGLSALLRLIIPIYLIVSALTFVARKPLSKLFTSDERIAAVAADYLAWVGPTFVLFGGVLGMLAFLEQIGKARAAFALNAIYFAVMITVAFALPQPVTSGTLARMLAVGNLLGFWTLLTAVVLLVRRPDRQRNEFLSVQAG